MSDLIFNERAQQCLTEYASTGDGALLVRAMRQIHLALDTYHPDHAYQGITCDHCGGHASGTTLLECDSGEIFCSESCIRSKHSEDDFDEDSPE